MLTRNLLEALPDEYLHEPELALGSGEDGLDATLSNHSASGKISESERCIVG